MLVGWRGNLCLLSIPDIGYNLSKVQSQLLTASGQKFTGEMWWNLLLALPWLQEYLMALMCFYWGISSRALLRNPAVWFILPVSSPFCFDWCGFFTLMNPSLTKRYSQHSSHVTDSVVWMVGFFHGCENSFCKRFEIPQCIPRQATYARGDAWRLLLWCSGLPTLSTALELVVSCMDGILAVHWVLLSARRASWVS